MLWTLEQIATLTGWLLMTGASLVATAALYWHALGKWRKCLYETYLLSDMQLWMKRHAKPKDSP